MMRVIHKTKLFEDLQSLFQSLFLTNILFLKQFFDDFQSGEIEKFIVGFSNWSKFKFK